MRRRAILLAGMKLGPFLMRNPKPFQIVPGTPTPRGGMGAVLAGLERPDHLAGVRVQPRGPLVVAITEDGSRVVAGGLGAVMVWDASSGHTLAVFDQGHEEVVSAVAIKADGRRVASAGPQRSVPAEGALGRTARYEGGNIYLWDVATGQARAEIISNNAADELRFAEDGTLFAAASEGRLVSAWKPDSDIPVGPGEIQRADLAGSFGDQLVRKVSFSRQCDRLVGRESATGRVTLRMFTGANLRTIPVAPTRETASAAALSADGSMVATVAMDHSISLWDFATMDRIRAINPPNPPVASAPSLIRFGPDGSSLVTGAENGTLRVWNVADGRLTRTIVGPNAPVRAVAFRRGGFRVVSGGWSRGGSRGESELVFWDVASVPMP